MHSLFLLKFRTIINIFKLSNIKLFQLFLLKFRTIINIFKLFNIKLYELFLLKNKTITNKFKLSNIFLVQLLTIRSSHTKLKQQTNQNIYHLHCIHSQLGLFLLKFRTIINIFKLSNIKLFELFLLKNKTIMNKFKLSNIFLVKWLTLRSSHTKLKQQTNWNIFHLHCINSQLGSKE